MSSNGKFSAIPAFREGNSPGTGGFASQTPVTRSFDVFFDLRLDKRISKQTIRRWFNSPLLWRHCNAIEFDRLLDPSPTLTCRWTLDKPTINHDASLKPTLYSYKLLLSCPYITAVVPCDNLRSLEATRLDVDICLRTFFSENTGMNSLLWKSLLYCLHPNEDILQGSFKLCDWLSLWCLWPWINHLPHVSRSLLANLF